MSPLNPRSRPTLPVLALLFGLAAATPLPAQESRRVLPPELERAMSAALAADTIVHDFDRIDSDSALLVRLSCPRIFDPTCREKNGRPILQVREVHLPKEREATVTLLTIAPTGGRVFRYWAFGRQSDSTPWVRVPPFDLVSVVHYLP